MSWGPCYFYYSCAVCGKRYKYAVDMIAELGKKFGTCPVCGSSGEPKKQGAVTSDDMEYEEVDE